MGKVRGQIVKRKPIQFSYNSQTHKERNRRKNISSNASKSIEIDNKKSLFVVDFAVIHNKITA